MDEGELLKCRGVEVEVVQSEDCIRLMRRSIEANPEQRNGDSGEP